MRLPLAGLLTLLITVTVMAADFPPPDQLPSRPGLPDPLVMLDGSRVTTKEEWFATFLPLEHGIPTHDTFGRVFARLDPEQLGQCFLGWVRAIQRANTTTAMIPRIPITRRARFMA